MILSPGDFHAGDPRQNQSVSHFKVGKDFRGPDKNLAGNGGSAEAPSRDCAKFVLKSNQKDRNR